MIKAKHNLVALDLASSILAVCILPTAGMVAVCAATTLLLNGTVSSHRFSNPYRRWNQTNRRWLLFASKEVSAPATKPALSCNQQ